MLDPDLTETVLVPWAECLLKLTKDLHKWIVSISAPVADALDLRNNAQIRFDCSYIGTVLISGIISLALFRVSRANKVEDVVVEKDVRTFNDIIAVEQLVKRNFVTETAIKSLYSTAMQIYRHPCYPVHSEGQQGVEEKMVTVSQQFGMISLLPNLHMSVSHVISVRPFSLHMPTLAISPKSIERSIFWIRD